MRMSALVFVALCCFFLPAIHSMAQKPAELIPDSIGTKFDNLLQFTSKGHWMSGGTMSLQSKNSSDKNQLVKYVEEDQVYDFAVKIDGAYAFADHNFAGMGLLYGQSKRDGLYQNSDGISYTENYFANRLSFTPFVKNLTPLDKIGRFNIITQIEFSNQIDQAITETDLNEELTRKYANRYTGFLGIRPGISVFVIKNVAFETTLNVAGVKYSYEKTKTTNLPDSKTVSTSVDFKIDILQLNIGIFVYL